MARRGTKKGNKSNRDSSVWMTMVMYVLVKIRLADNPLTSSVLRLINHIQAPLEIVTSHACKEAAT
jgi:hypothetical protein